MYDLDGSDSNREWIEIFNNGNESVQISSWRLYENDSNHKLTLVSGNEYLSSGEYAVVVDNPEYFLLDWSEFSGTLFDSSFSLHNSGELLIIRDSELNDIDSVTYSSELGAKGDGNSLYYSGTGWSFGSPSPGAGPLSISGVEEIVQPEESISSESSSVSKKDFPVEQQIFAFAGKDKTVTVGASSLFEGIALGLSNKAIPNARFVWSFGDGGKEEGKSVLYHYRYPGKYIVVLDVSSGEYSASDRVLVSAVPANVIIKSASRDRVEVQNNSDMEIDLSWWILSTKEDSFIIPENTIILPKQSVFFSSSITNIFPENTSDAYILYPNGTIVSPEEKIIEEKKILISKTSENIVSQQSIVGKEIPAVEESGGPLKTINTIDPQLDSQLANTYSIISKETDKKDNGWNMYLFLFVIIVFGSVSVLFLRREARNSITILD
jgi:hypothetical protein